MNKNHTETAIRLVEISKKYEIHHEKPTLVESFVKGKNETFWALKNITVSISKGEKVGIIGHNGSGKTTLLKIIAGIAAPTAGSIHTRGKIISLIDLEAGFHPDLTGYQNIYLNGMLLGLRKRDIDHRIRDIIAYADLRQFIDAPLFTYSSGMLLRLGFSVAIHGNPDILLIDETLSAADNQFQKKANNTLTEFFRREKTIVVVTHDIGFIAKTCKRFLIFQDGVIVRDGGARVLAEYDKS